MLPFVQGHVAQALELTGALDVKPHDIVYLVAQDELDRIVVHPAQEGQDRKNCLLQVYVVGLQIA